MTPKIPFILTLFTLTFTFASATLPPKFSSEYTSTGWIILPYAEINEPFTAYYSRNANKSRIDYYGDLMLTVQRPDIESVYKIAYMTDYKGNAARNCFVQNETDAPGITIQSIFPDLTDFKIFYSGSCSNTKDSHASALGDKEHCEGWQYVNVVGQKKNVYSFFLRRDSKGNPIPIIYIMMGYDSLLGSHYDKYEIVYQTYIPGTVDESIFDIVSNFSCHGYPGPGREALGLVRMNPMHEFIHGNTQHVQEDFESFKDKHSKDYDNGHEHSMRYKIFLNNHRFIESHNRRLTQYKMAINHLADRTDDELKALRGRASSSPFGGNGGIAFDKTQYNLEDVPENFDWRIMGAVTPVKDQAICGSCWSFGTTGTIEGVYFVKTGNLVSLSEQQLIDCSWNEGNNACDGGEDFRAYDYIIKAGGIALADDYATEYGSYLGADGKCHDKAVKKAVQLEGFVNITVGDAQALEAAIYFNGPTTVAIDASPKTFSFYSHGIYYDPSCSSTQLDHQVLAVGFGSIKGEKYWLIKNSWSTYYGNDGYVLISQKNNDCGVTTDATYPIIA